MPQVMESGVLWEITSEQAQAWQERGFIAPIAGKEDQYEATPLLWKSGVEGLRVASEIIHGARRRDGS